MDAQWRRAVQAEMQAAFKLIMMALEREEWYRALIAKDTTPQVHREQVLLLISCTSTVSCVHYVCVCSPLASSRPIDKNLLLNENVTLCFYSNSDWIA